MNFLDLFSGIGGFALACSMANLKIDAHYFSEVEPYAVRVYEKNFPQAVGLGDVRTIDGKALRDQHSGQWLVTGGFPCQDISTAGLGHGLDGARSGLFFEIVRILRDLRPEYVLLENVSALRSRGLGRVLTALASIGYSSCWTTISASDVGAPHKRERVWIVAYPDSHGTRAGADALLEIERDLADYRQTHHANGGTSLWSDWEREIASREEHNRPVVRRMDDGLSDWLDRIAGLGNATVPQAAALILRAMTNR